MIRQKEREKERLSSRKQEEEEEEEASNLDLHSSLHTEKPERRWLLLNNGAYCVFNAVCLLAYCSRPRRRPAAVENPAFHGMTCVMGICTECPALPILT